MCNLPVTLAEKRSIIFQKVDFRMYLEGNGKERKNEIHVVYSETPHTLYSLLLLIIKKKNC